ncbi:MAG: hypothetical protein ACE5JL_09310, partial [Dehalococcoidia bacterium]
MAAREQEEFLLSVRRSLGRPGMTPPVDRERLLGPTDGTKSASMLWEELEARVHEQRDLLVESLTREFQRVHGQVAQINDQRALEQHLRELMSRRDTKRVVRWDTPLLEDLEPVLSKSGATVTTIQPSSEE